MNRGELKFQIVRNARNRWLIWQLDPAFDVPGGHGRGFEEVARVVEDGGLFYVEVPEWGDDGIDDWRRQPRGWMTKDGAVASVTREKKAMAS